MTVLAVIPCLNEELHIEGLVTYLLAEQTPLKIVIADGGSSDRTPELAKHLAATHSNVFYLHNPGRLQAAAINLAAKEYGKEAEFLIRIDAHAEYPPRYCQTLLEEAQIMGADSVVVAMNTMGKDRFGRAAATAQNSILGNGGSAHRRSHATQGRWVDHGHHALMRIEAFNTVGGYDESFSHNEDAELDIRLRKAGYKIWLTDKTFLTYYPRSTVSALFKQYMRYGQGRIRTIRKHRAKPKLRQMLPAAVVPALLLALLSPWICAASIPLLAWAAICLSYGVALRDPLAGVAAMVMHLGWSAGFWRGLLGAK